jgi:hypothetical protein
VSCAYNFSVMRIQLCVRYLPFPRRSHGILHIESPPLTGECGSRRAATKIWRQLVPQLQLAIVPARAEKLAPSLSANHIVGDSTRSTVLLQPQR